MYNQINVIINPNAAYHSIYFGAPCSAPFSIKSKSSTRFNDAIPMTKSENRMPVIPLPKRLPMKEMSKSDKIRFNKYIISMPKVAENTPNLKFSVAAINLLLYKNNRAIKIPNVNAIA